MQLILWTRVTRSHVGSFWHRFEYSVCIHYPSYVCCTCHRSCCSDRSANIWWTVHVTKRHVTQLSPSYSYLIFCILAYQFCHCVGKTNQASCAHLSYMELHIPSEHRTGFPIFLCSLQFRQVYVEYVVPALCFHILIQKAIPGIFLVMVQPTFMSLWVFQW
jgi:hypothetical protein